ncbi:hypothetical protein AB0929_29885 [Streptomyces massasporeus]|uniref:hypothetical protein n=1 Tax=Streptomyces massasporeus TaxID=67324 RepID=UPI0034519D58
MLGLARQPYYRWLACPVTDAELAEAYRANALFDAHRDDPDLTQAVHLRGRDAFAAGGSGSNGRKLGRAAVGAARRGADSLRE